MEYGFSVATSSHRERGYILIPGLKTARVAPVINIGMSAPDWIKFLTAYGYYEKVNLEDETQLNNVIFNQSKGMFFQGLKWRIQDPSDAAGFGIGIVTLNDRGILSTRNPERIIANVSSEITKDEKSAFTDFVRIFTPSVISKTSMKELRSVLKATAMLREPKRTDAIIAITVRLIKEALMDKTVREQNEIAGSIYDFLSILGRLKIEPSSITSKDLVTILCSSKPGNIPPHLLPEDIAVIIHEFVRNFEAGGLPIALSFIVSDILGASKTKYPEMILGEANRRLPSDASIEKNIRKLYKRIQQLITAKGFACKISEDEFFSICSCDEIRKEAIWWEYNVTLGSLEELMRAFVGPYRDYTPWSGKSRKEFLRLSADPKWLRDASIVLQRTADLAKNVSSNYFYSSVIEEFHLLTWFNDVQPLVNTRLPLDNSFKRLWELTEKMAQLDNNAVANYDTKTDTIMLHRDPRDTDPYIQRSIVFTWLNKFSRVWSTSN